MCLSLLYSVFEAIGPLVGASFATATWLVASIRPPLGRILGAVRHLARLGNGAFHLFAFYLAVAWGPRLAWSIPGWALALAALLLLGALATFRRTQQNLRIPIALPVGIIILASLLGWLREEGFARCDDYHRLRTQSGLEILFPSTDEFTRCEPGQSFPILRYPRKIWESPDSRRYVVTTTISSDPRTRNQPHRGGGSYDGLFCEVRADGSGRPHCVGGVSGKTHQVDVIEPRGELFSCAWGLDPDGRGRGKRSAIFRLSQQEPLEILEEHSIYGTFAMYGFYDPATDEYHTLTDECGPILSFRGSDFATRPALPVADCPGATIYDAARNEGVMCGGMMGFVAFRLDPWRHRIIGRKNNPSGRLWLSWGCDWDPVGRAVYALVPNLGILAVIDYDTGMVRQTHFVGFALRTVAFDAPRHLVYLSDFLGGDVIAIDANTGNEVNRWFAGHYLRELRIARDGKKLLTASNLGIVRIDLEDL